jgi:hypothetical protein
VKSLARPSVLCVIVLIGCHRGVGSGGVAANQISPAAIASQNSELFARLPAPVTTAFEKSHPRVAATRVHVRLFPDGSTHYQIIYVDGEGRTRQAEYYGNGRSTP